MFSSAMPFWASGVYYAFEHSDLCGRVIVVLMLVGSIAAWSIMFEKWISLKRMLASTDSFIQSFRQRRYFVQAMVEAKKKPGPAAVIYLAAMEKILEIYGDEDSARLGGTAADEMEKRGLERVDYQTIRIHSDDFIDLWAQRNGWAAGVHNRRFGIHPGFGG